MATPLLSFTSTFRGSAIRKITTSGIMTPTTSTSSNQQRRRRPHRDAPASGDSSGATQHARPPRHPRTQEQRSTPPRPTHFLALPIGHHPDLRSAVQSLTASWLSHNPPIEGLDPSIVINPRRLHLTLGVMTLAPPRTATGPEAEGHNLAAAAQLLAAITPRIRTVLARAPLRVPLGRITVMQPDPTRAHVLYAEPELSSPDGRRLRAVCGTCFCPISFPRLYVSPP